MADFLDSMAKYMSLSEDEFQDKEFEGEMAYYSNLDSKVKLDHQIPDYYNQFVSKATTAARTAKSTKSSINSSKETIEKQEETLSEAKERLRDTYHKIRQARRERYNTMPLSKEEAKCNENIKNLKRQFKTGNKKKREMIEKINEKKKSLIKKNEEISQYNEVIKEAKLRRDKLIQSVRKQFDAINKILAMEQYIKTMDLNDPRIDVKKIKHIFDMLNSSKEHGKLVISLTNPTTDKTTEFMEAFNSYIANIKPDEKIKLNKNENKIIGDRKKYVTTLKEYQIPDELEK